ncbi:hypothetical protein [Streptomyces abyssomicinicus]|uniref:hypothetical protein n=1 Tax=Streptomyces abyssomicinicus TaxID=574929 RepID=UPI00124FBDFD|nr:hypothetical protein [Streptomyces abyssomicinicus]
MQGLGHHQPVTPPPPTGLLVFLRILFVTVAVGSIGLLMWVPMLRLAIVTRKVLDWVLFGLSFVLLLVSCALLMSEPDDEVDTAPEVVGVLMLLITLVAVISYYLVAEIRHYEQRRRHPGAAFGHGHTGAGTGYGYPYTGNPYGSPQPPGTWSGGHTPAPHTAGSHIPAPHTAGPHTPAPHTAGSHTAVPTPSHTATPTPPVTPPVTPAPGGRIDQVRAELDELSDYLRKQDGGPENAR